MPFTSPILMARTRKRSAVDYGVQGCPERQLLLPDVVSGWKTHPLYATPKQTVGPRHDQRRWNRLSRSAKRSAGRGHSLFSDLGTRRAIGFLPGHDEYLPARTRRGRARAMAAVRLTSKKLLGWDGVWLDNDNILFLSRAADEKDYSIYRISTNGKNLKRLIKNARLPTVSAPVLLLRISAQKLFRFRDGHIDFACVFAGTLRALGSTTAFPINDGHDFPNDFVRLKFRCHFFWDGCG